MAVAYDNAGSDQNGSASRSFTTSGSDRYLGSGINVGFASYTPTSVTYNSVGLTAVLTDTDDTDLYTWDLIAPASGSNTLADSGTGSTNDRVGVSFISFTGVHQTTARGTAVQATPAASSPITVDVSSATDEIVVDFAAIRDSATTITVGSGQTERVNNTALQSSGNSVRFGVSTETGATTTTMSWTHSGGSGYNWVTHAWGVKPAGAATANPHYPLGHPLFGPFAGPVGA